MAVSKKCYNNLLANILRWAREPARSYLKHDPMARVNRMKIGRDERRLSRRDFLETFEIPSLPAATETTEEAAVVHLALFCGLRRGEIFALRWSDIEQAPDGTGRIHVRRSISAGQLSTPKTGNAIRTVDAAKDVLAVLNRHREAHAEEGDFILARQQGVGLTSTTGTQESGASCASVQAFGKRSASTHCDTRSRPYCSTRARACFTSQSRWDTPRPRSRSTSTATCSRRRATRLWGGCRRRSEQQSDKGWTSWMALSSDRIGTAWIGTPEPNWRGSLRRRR